MSRSEKNPWWVRRIKEHNPDMFWSGVLGGRRSDTKSRLIRGLHKKVRQEGAKQARVLAIPECSDEFCFPPCDNHAYELGHFDPDPWGTTEPKYTTESQGG